MKAVVCNGCRHVIERFHPGTDVPADGILFTHFPGGLGHLCADCSQTIRLQIKLMGKESECQT